MSSFSLPSSRCSSLIVPASCRIIRNPPTAPAHSYSANEREDDDDRKSRLFATTQSRASALTLSFAEKNSRRYTAVLRATARQVVKEIEKEEKNEQQGKQPRKKSDAEFSIEPHLPMLHATLNKMKEWVGKDPHQILVHELMEQAALQASTQPMKPQQPQSAKDRTTRAKRLVQECTNSFAGSAFSHGDNDDRRSPELVSRALLDMKFGERRSDMRQTITAKQDFLRKDADVHLAFDTACRVAKQEKVDKLKEAIESRKYIHVRPPDERVAEVRSRKHAQLTQLVMNPSSTTVIPTSRMSMDSLERRRWLVILVQVQAVRIFGESFARRRLGFNKKIAGAADHRNLVVLFDFVRPFQGQEKKTRAAAILDRNGFLMSLAWRIIRKRKVVKLIKDFLVVRHYTQQIKKSVSSYRRDVIRCQRQVRAFFAMRAALYESWLFAWKVFWDKFVDEEGDSDDEDVAVELARRVVVAYQSLLVRMFRDVKAEISDRRRRVLSSERGGGSWAPVLRRPTKEQIIKLGRSITGR